MALVSIGKAAKILGVNVRRLAYLCKLKNVKYTLTPKKRKVFDTDNLAIVNPDIEDFAYLVDHEQGYSAKDAALYINTSVQTIYRLIKKGVLTLLQDDDIKKLFIDGPSLVKYKSTKGEKSTKIVNSVNKVMEGSLVIPALPADTHQKDQIAVSVFTTIQDNKIELAIEGIVHAITDSMPDCREGEAVLSGQKFLDWIKFSILREIEDFYIFDQA